jgi:hypothetical protein
MTKKLLQAGDVIELKAGHKVYAEIPKHFAYANRKGDFSLTRAEAQIGGELAYLAGLYIVTHVASDGGGTGMGPHDVYPDGHHVHCERTSDRLKVDFYQTGCFTAMIPEIEPVGKAELKWEAAVFFKDKLPK